MQLCYYYTFYFSAIVKTVLVPSDALVDCFTSNICTDQIGSMSIPALECCVNNSGTTFLFDGACRLCFG